MKSKFLDGYTRSAAKTTLGPDDGSKHFHERLGSKKKHQKKSMVKDNSKQRPQTSKRVLCNVKPPAYFENEAARSQALSRHNTTQRFKVQKNGFFKDLESNKKGDVKQLHGGVFPIAYEKE